MTMRHANVITRNVLSTLDGSQLETVRTDRGYYVVHGTNEQFSHRKVTKKTYDLLNKAFVRGEE